MKTSKKSVTLFVFIFLFFIANAQRQTVNLNGSWGFSIDSLKQGISQHWFQQGIPTTIVEPVTVPHTWNVKKETVRYWGWGWYQKNITIPKYWRDKLVHLQFDAVYHSATVWVNGQKAGEHNGSGYTKFFIDVTRFIKVGKQNNIVVLADNSFSRENIPFDNSFDWGNDGGIIRGVSLFATNKVFIKQIFAKGKPNFNDKENISGKLNVKILLSGRQQQFKNLVFHIRATEENQSTTNIVFDGKPTIKIVGNEASFFIDLKKVNLWHFDDPNLYKLSVNIYDGNKQTDSLSALFDFKELKVVGEKIFLNGEAVRLAGIEWMPGSSLDNGMAQTHQELEESLIKIKKLNCQLTRFHWQQDDFVLDWCSRNGILVQEEIPIWGRRTLLYDTILTIAKIQLKAMVEQHYNYPCVIAWGVGNEMDGRTQQTIDGVKELYQFTKNLDSGRLVNYVSNTLQVARHWAGNVLPDASQKGDVLMYNDYHSTWYRQSHGTQGAMLDTINAENPGKPLCISEWGLCEPENWGDDNRRVMDLIYTKALYDNKPYIAASIYFCLNDYLTHMGSGKLEHYTTRVHGLYDFYGNPKPSAKVFKDLFCPIEISGLNRNKDGKIAITLVGSSGLPSFTLKNYKVYWSNDEAGYKNGLLFNLPEMLPGKLTDVFFENKYNNKGIITIENTRGRVIYQKIIESTSVY